MRAFHLDPPDGYSPEIGRFVTMLADTRRRLLRDIEGLDEGDLDRSPPWEPNSIGTLLYHIGAIELDWTFTDILEGAAFPDGFGDLFPVDVREADGRLTPFIDDVEGHLGRLDWVRGHLLRALRRLSDEDLDRTVGKGDQESGIGFILHHLMQHEAEHRGQIGEIRAGMASA